MTELPVPGEHSWASKLNQAIEERDNAVAQGAQAAVDALEGVVVRDYATKGYVDLVVSDVSNPSISDVDGLQDALDAKQPVGNYADQMQALPAGGDYGQVLTKTSSANYAVEWASPATGGGALTPEQEALLQQVEDATTVSIPHTLVRRDGDGHMVTPPPTASYHAARKGYVDAQDAATLQDAKDYADLGVRVVTHGTNANTSRPAGAVVWWIGSVEPLNAEPHDVWDDSEND